MQTVNKKKRQLPDIITVWESDGTLDDYGNPKYLTPKHYWVRHEYAQKLYRTSDGREVRSSSVLWTDINIGPIGSLIYTDHSYSNTPVVGALELQDIQMNKTLSGKNPVYRFMI